MTQRDTILRDIAQQLDNMPEYGQLQVFVKAHIGGVGKVDMVKMTDTKYEDNDPNVTAATDIYRMIKSMADAHVTGTLGFSLAFHNGSADTLSVQDFRRL